MGPDKRELTVTATTVPPCEDIKANGVMLAAIPAGFLLTEDKFLKILLMYNLKGECLTVEEVNALLPVGGPTTKKDIGVTR